MRKLLTFSSLGVVAAIVALAIRGRMVALEIGRNSPNCHGKYYPVFWYCCLALIAIAAVLCLAFLVTLLTKRIVYRKWELATFAAGIALITALVFSKGPEWFIEWLLGDCLDYGLIW